MVKECRNSHETLSYSTFASFCPVLRFTTTKSFPDDDGEFQRFLSSGELEKFQSFWLKGESRLRIAKILTENRERIIKQAGELLFHRRPDIISPGGNAFGEQKTAVCLRDLDYYLRLVQYGLIAGDTTPIDEIGLLGMREIFNSLDIPISAFAEGTRAMKSVTFSLLSEEDAIEAAIYFDHIIVAFDGNTSVIPLETPTQKPIEPEPPPPLDDKTPKRHVNVCITGYGEQGCLPKTTSLGVSKDYALRINIGSLSPDSIVMNPAKFPDHILPEKTEVGYWLDVAVESSDFTISKPLNHLFLPKHGSSWVCNCLIEEPHVCNKDTRRPYLLIPIGTPQEPKDAELQISLLYHNNLIQSQCLTAEIIQVEGTGNGHRSKIDYNRHSLDDLSDLQPRTLNLLTRSSNHGTHKIWINGGKDGSLVFNLAEGQMRDAVKSVRQALCDIHFRDVEGNRKNLYKEDNSKARIDFIKDLKLLADCGNRLWNTLLYRDDSYWDKLSNPSNIQISRVGGSNFVFPWNFLYDLPLEPGNSSKYKECPLLRNWDNVKTHLSKSARRCPYESEHNPMNTICPFGFWGFKHVIEQLPSVPIGWNLPSIIRIIASVPALIVGRSLNLNSKLTEAHLKQLAPVTDCSSRDKLRDALVNSIEIIYFYTHGRRQEIPGISQKIPALELGNGELLEPGDIVTWRRAIWPKYHWQDPSPLVFINGCHTAELTPESLVNFVDNFATAYAAGVIGTEITLSQRVANEAAEQFFKHFRDNKTVEESLQQMRIHFLKKGNLLGLAYTAYCSTDLELSKANTQSVTNDFSLV